MKRVCFRAMLTAGVLVLALGCARTKLESRPLNAQEAAWADTISGWYSNWEPPYLTPVRPDRAPLKPNPPSQTDPRSVVRPRPRPMMPPAYDQDVELVPAE